MARAKKERAKYVAVIESLDQEGRGVARRDGKVVFIEGALPGERCVVAVAQPCQRKSNTRSTAANLLLN